MGLYGSSPRMWGTRLAKTGNPDPGWFIPTHVGNSRLSMGATAILAVHPHACGELGVTLRRLTFQGGSSPRMWGTLVITMSSANRIGFIPTHVGNSIRVILVVRQSMVHPHACGELFPASSNLSPPFWFIPTHVGNSILRIVLYPGREVHPHACGELRRTGVLLVTPGGSSPRMWGTPVQIPAARSGTWFIPTHVGNSCRCM